MHCHFSFVYKRSLFDFRTRRRENFDSAAILFFTPFSAKNFTVHPSLFSKVFFYQVKVRKGNYFRRRVGVRAAGRRRKTGLEMSPKAGPAAGAGLSVESSDPVRE